MTENLEITKDRDNIAVNTQKEIEQKTGKLVISIQR